MMSLPQEIQYEIIKYGGAQEVMTLSLTCKGMYELCRDPLIWMKLIESKFPLQGMQKKHLYWLNLNDIDKPSIHVSEPTKKYLREGKIENSKEKVTYLNLRKELPKLTWNFILRFKCPCTVCVITSGRVLHYHVEG